MTHAAVEPVEHRVDLAGVARACLARWWLVLVVVLLGTAAAGLVAAQRRPQFAGRLTFYVASTVSTDESPFSDDELSQQRAASYAVLLRGNRLARMVVRSAGVHRSATQVAAQVSATVQTDTVLIDVTVLDTSQTRARAIATAIATDFPALVQLTTPAGTSSQPVLTVVTGPGVSAAPVLPDKRLYLELGALAGLLAGIGAAVLLANLDNRIRSEEQLGRATHTPMLARISYDAAMTSAVPALLPAACAEQFRHLRTGLQFLDLAAPVRTVSVAGCSGREGASTVAAQLALAVADTGRHVCLVDCNLRTPALADEFDLRGAPGLTNHLVGSATVRAILHKRTDRLTVVPSGPRPPNPTELLGAPVMRDLLARLRRRFDVVVLDTGAVLPVADTRVTAAYADGTILAVRYGHSTQSDVVAAARRLGVAPGRLLGTVLTMAPRTESSSYYETQPAPGQLAGARR